MFSSSRVKFEVKILERRMGIHLASRNWDQVVEVVRQGVQVSRAVSRKLAMVVRIRKGKSQERGGGGRVSHTFLTWEFTAGPSDRIVKVSRVGAAGCRGTAAAGPPGAPVRGGACCCCPCACACATGTAL